jgi:hypothetical protein
MPTPEPTPTLFVCLNLVPLDGHQPPSGEEGDVLRDFARNPNAYRTSWRTFETAEQAEQYRMAEDSACISVLPAVCEFNPVLGF